MKTTFSNKAGKAYYFNEISGFLVTSSNEIIGQLTRMAFESNKDQTDAWENQIESLKYKLKENGVEGFIIFEYDIVRLGKRIDVVLLIRHMVFSLEFKNGKNTFTAEDAQQAEDYAIDLKNFHKESENLYVCPILIATEAKKINPNQLIDSYPNKEISLQRENINSFISKIMIIAKKYGDDQTMDYMKWFDSPYYPTPTIIEAAIQVYKYKDVTEIAKSEAGQEGINQCENTLNGIVDYAKQNHKKCVCFVTGVPGAGKTLVGLDLVSKNLGNDRNNASIYLSGNGALVSVLRKALERSAVNDGKKVKDVRQGIMALIQDSYNFKKYNYPRRDETPEHILVFDEAQRVWDQRKMSAKHKGQGMDVSEPYMYYSIMDRHEDWAVIVCLVGLGQDIYDGEVGINEWFRCGIDDFSQWELFYSPKIFDKEEDKGIDVDSITKCTRCHPKLELHLQTSIRSYKADKQAKFVDALLNNQPALASKYLNAFFEKYPVYVTRDLETAKKWARSNVKGSERCGIVASSAGQRLRTEGIYVPKDLDVENWFLAKSNDIRSSNMMEVAASEFKIQGLELDWAIVGWDADLRRTCTGSDWDYFGFRGNSWVKRKQEITQRYLLNSYRVLLTRARRGMVLFVPKGVDVSVDKTRDSKIYDGIYSYLKNCGIKDLNE